MTATPKYMEVYTDIKNKIIHDEFPINSLLPSGDELAEHYHCSKLTVKKGLDLLVKEGILLRRRGSGTVVLRKPMGSSLAMGPTAGLLNTVGEEHVTSKIHKFSIELPSQEVADYLQIPTNEYIYHIIRSRYIDDEPYSLEETYMPLSLIKGLEPVHLEKSVYRYITETLGLLIHSSHVWIRGDMANVQDEAILDVDKGTFIMEIMKTAFLDTGVPFEFSVTRHIYTNFVFEAVFVEN